MKIFYGVYEALAELTFEFINKKSSYKSVQVNTLSAFDIETSNGYVNPQTGIAEKFNHDLALTNYYEKVEKVSIMYVWQYAIQNTDGEIFVFLGRTWEQFREFTGLLSDIILIKKSFPDYNTDPSYFNNMKDFQLRCDLLSIINKKPSITFMTYVHNLGFEFQHLRNVWQDDFTHAKKSSVFAREKRHPMKFNIKVHNVRFEYRDSLSLSGLSLKAWTAGLSIEKLDEPADFYTPILTPITPLSYERIQYSINDVASMIVALEEYKNEYYNIFDIPLTQTGIIRRKAISTCQASKEGREWINHCYDINYNMDYDFYLDLCDIFAGGWTHANSVYTDRLIKDVDCYDLASSYPAIMCLRTLPIGKFEKVDPSEYDDLLAQDLKAVDLKYHYWLEFEVEEVDIKTFNTFWSSSKCVELVNPILDNGKIYTAEKVRLKMTDLDFDIFQRCYDFKNLNIIRMYKSESGYLPKVLVELILDQYGEKTSLKPDEDCTDPVQIARYGHAKVFVNGIYGCFVYKDFSDNIEFEGEWEKFTKDRLVFDTEYKADIEKHHLKQWGMYQLGVWITATGRHNLWDTMLTDTGDHLVDEHTAYGDTDSLKGVFDDDDKKVIDNFNDYILSLHEYMSEKYDIPLEKFSPLTPKGKAKPLGIFAPDGHYEEFKTLGAKRYCYKDNEGIHTVIAGLKKSKGAEKITSLGGVSNFNNHLVWDTIESEKLAAHYLDNQPHTVWIDENGERYESDDKYGINLQPIPFDMSLTDEYEALIALVRGDIDNPLYFENVNDFYKRHILGLDEED